MIAPRPASDDRVSTVDVLVGRLRQAILDGGIEAGGRLNEVALARDMSVSRHTLRAALAQLVRDGLLRHVPNRGMFVPLPEQHDLMDLHRFRQAIELEAARQALERAAGFEEVRLAHQALEDLPPGASWSQVTDVHNEVHRAIVDSAGSERLSAAYAAIQVELTLYLRQIRPRYDQTGILAIHRELLRGLLHGKRPLEGLQRDLDRGKEALTIDRSRV